MWSPSAAGLQCVSLLLDGLRVTLRTTVHAALPSLPDSSGQSASLAGQSPPTQPPCANVVPRFAVAVVTPSAAVLTLATELLPLPAPLTAVWSVVNADCSALIWTLNAPCISPMSVLSLACKSSRSACSCFSVLWRILTCRRLASDASRAALSAHCVLLTCCDCAGLLAECWAGPDDPELPDAVDPHAAAVIVMVAAAAAARIAPARLGASTPHVATARGQPRHRLPRMSPDGMLSLGMARSTATERPACMMNTASSAPATAVSALRQRWMWFIRVSFPSRAIGLVTVCAALYGDRH